jgi:hypothetical protein
VILEDRTQGIFIDLKQHASFHEVLIDSTMAGTGRFFLHLAGQPSSNRLRPDQAFLVYALDHEIFIEGSTRDYSHARIIDPSGRILRVYKLNGDNLNVLPAPDFAPGVYMVQVYGVNCTKTMKVFIR